MGKYEPHFDHDFQRGLVGENLVETFLAALQGTKIETKTDYQAGSTGNVYIETYQRRLTGEWVKSGINITESEWFALAGPAEVGFIVIRTDVLKKLAAEAPKSSTNVSNKETRATVGRLVKVKQIIAKIFADKESL